MNGICLVWSRGRLISPSLPVGDDRYLNLSSEKRPTGRNLGGNRLVRRSGATSRGTALLTFSLRMRAFLTTEFLTICLRKRRIGTTNYTPTKLFKTKFTDEKLLEMLAVLKILKFITIMKAIEWFLK